MLRSVNKKLSSQKLANPNYHVEDALEASIALSTETDLFDVSNIFLPINVPRSGKTN